MQPAELLPSFCNGILLPHLKSLQYKLQYHYQSLKNTSENQYGDPPPSMNLHKKIMTQELYPLRRKFFFHTFFA